MDNILIEQLVEKILTNSELEDADKKFLLTSLTKRGMFTPGYYFHESEDRDAIEVWYRNAEPDGSKEHGNTRWNDPNMVISEYLRAKALAQQK